uniref:Uncharacterized protein n=1 Tax=Desertifilum tharense IPPAS B-1220 TaxID=1781255 RepID=A0ACD5H247_9CYAN
MVLSTPLLGVQATELGTYIAFFPPTSPSPHPPILFPTQHSLPHSALSTQHSALSSPNP